MPVSDNAGERKVIERPLNYKDAAQLREKRDKDFQKHLKDRRERTAMAARGGMDTMENEYLKARQERELKEMEQLAEKYAPDDNDYCHAVTTEEELYDEMMRREQQEIEEMTERLKI